MMPARAYWKGHMKLSLVTFPVALFSAVSSGERIAFHQVERHSGARIRELKVVPGEGEVQKEDIAKGYEYERGKFVIVEDEDLEKIRLETRKVIELTQFFAADELDPVYLDKSYWVAPDGPVAEEAFAVIREAMRRSNRMAMGRVVMNSRERLVTLAGRDKGFALFTLHPGRAVRKPESIFEDVRDTPLNPDEIAVAEQLIKSRTARLDPDHFVDRYQDELRKIIEAKLQGRTPDILYEREPSNVVDLMDALKRSLMAEAPEPPPAPAPAPAPAEPERKGRRKKA